MLWREGMEPDAAVSLRTVASELRVSRSPVYQALTVLVVEGLLGLDARGRRRFYVCPLTIEAMTDALDVRCMLELFAAERSVGRADAVRLDDLRGWAEEVWL